MVGHPARNLSVRCAVNQSGRVICENSQRGSPTAMTSATRVNARLPPQCSKNMRGRRDTVASLQASSLRLLWRTFWHGDATLLGQQVLQEDVQKRPPPRKLPHPVRLDHSSVFLRWWRLSCYSACSCRAHAAFARIRPCRAGRRATSSNRIARVP